MQTLEQAMQSGLEAGVFPGAVLRVERAGRCLHASAHGRTALEAGGRPVELDTAFDLASLTKPLATTSLAMQAVDRGALELSAPLGRLLPELAEHGRAGLSAEQLLAHSSGLPAWLPLHLSLSASQVATPAGRERVRALVAAAPLEAPPGTRVEYSDLGFILLEWALERALGLPFARAFYSLVCAPLELEGLFFVELMESAGAIASGWSFAATERCPWRGRVMQGEVHDENAYAMGGVAGHAGLFGTAEAVARVGQAWLDALAGRSGPFEPAVMERFARRAAGPARNRPLGFDCPEREHSQAGTRLARSALGHLGFTGTSVWIEPEREVCVVLLTNRIHPSRANEALRDFRPRLHDLVLDCLEREDAPA
jgi:CubicO group peptidase (beta-lactamase class C family)